MAYRKGGTDKGAIEKENNKTVKQSRECSNSKE